MCDSTQPLKVSQELVRTYAQRRNSHLVSISGDDEHGEEPDPYAFVEGDEEFSFIEKRDKAAAEKEGGKKHKVGCRQECCNASRDVCVRDPVYFSVQKFIINKCFAPLLEDPLDINPVRVLNVFFSNDGGHIS